MLEKGEFLMKQCIVWWKFKSSINQSLQSRWFIFLVYIAEKNLFLVLWMSVFGKLMKRSFSLVTLTSRSKCYCLVRFSLKCKFYIVMPIVDEIKNSFAWSSLRKMKKSVIQTASVKLRFKISRAFSKTISFKVI